MSKYTVSQQIDDWKKDPNTELRLEKRALQDVPKDLVDMDINEFTITKLSFARNDFKSLQPKFFKKQNKITELILASNRFSDCQNNKETFKSLKYLLGLRTLDFSENRIYDPIGFMITLKSLGDLQTLILRKFNMGIYLGSSLNHLSSLVQLERLDLSECNIHGFPTLLLRLTNLVDLDLSFNHFSTIPGQIGQLSKVKQLGLDGCSITHIPEEISDLENMEVLRLNYNELATLPDNMKKMKQLTQIQLMHNNFTEIPSCLVENDVSVIPTLSVFFFQGNPLEKKENFNSNSIKFGTVEVLIQSSDNLAKPSLISEKQLLLEFREESNFGEIYLGCYSSAKNKHYLERCGIKSILVVGDRLSQIYPLRFKYLQFELEDDEDDSLQSFFKEGTEFIHRARERGGVLIHCAAGISRSASMVIAYFIRYEKMTVAEAFERVKSRRDFIHPNKAFVTQLEEFESQFAVKTKKSWSLFDKNKKKEKRSPKAN